MGKDKRPQLPPPRVSRSEYQPKQQNTCSQVEASVSVQKSSEKRACQNSRPHAVSFQRVKEVTYLYRLLENRIDDGQENDKWQCQATVCQRLDFSIGRVQKIKDHGLEAQQHQRDDTQ